MAANNNFYLVVVLVQLIYAGMYLLSKAAFNEGMNTFVFVFYRQGSAVLFVTPVAIISVRKGSPLPQSFMLLLKMFLLSLVGVTFSLNLYSVALDYTSASVASATTNSVPVITFFLALLMGMEKINLRRLSSLAKLLGMALCLGGVVAIAFYREPSLALRHAHLGHSGSQQHRQHHSQVHSTGTWIKGCFLLVTANATWSFWLVMQGKLLKEYPHKVIFTAFQCLFSAIQSFLVALVFERRISGWKLRLDVGLLAIAYCGMVVTGVAFYLQAWCIQKKGPVFLAMFTPLVLVITSFFSFFILGEVITLGSVLGGFLMVGGLYSVLWGKRSEQSQDAQNGVSTDGAAAHKLPVQVTTAKECAPEEIGMASPFHPL